MQNNTGLIRPFKNQPTVSVPLLTNDTQTLHVTSYQKHHFPYNQTSSCCCHGDGRLRFYASDCLNSALCLSTRTRPRADLGGIHVCPLRSNYRRQDGGRVVVRLLCETWNCFCPSSSWRRDNTAFIPHQRLVLFLWRESVRSVQPGLISGFKKRKRRRREGSAALKVATGEEACVEPCS